MAQLRTIGVLPDGQTDRRSPRLRHIALLNVARRSQESIAPVDRNLDYLPSHLDGRREPSPKDFLPGRDL
jgi:hypothetical protein